MCLFPPEHNQVPELEEVFSIRLLNASSGATVTTTASQVATVTVQANDHPYGLFTFSSAFRPLTVSEDVGEVEVMVTREFGDTGSVIVGYSTVESGDSSLDGLIDLIQLAENRYVFRAYYISIHIYVVSYCKILNGNCGYNTGNEMRYY